MIGEFIALFVLGVAYGAIIEAYVQAVQYYRERRK